MGTKTNIALTAAFGAAAFGITWFATGGALPALQAIAHGGLVVSDAAVTGLTAGCEFVAPFLDKGLAAMPMPS